MAKIFSQYFFFPFYKENWTPNHLWAQCNCSHADIASLCPCRSTPAGLQLPLQKDMGIPQLLRCACCSVTASWRSWAWVVTEGDRPWCSSEHKELAELSSGGSFHICCRSAALCLLQQHDLDIQNRHLHLTGMFDLDFSGLCFLICKFG